VSDPGAAGYHPFLSNGLCTSRLAEGADIRHDLVNTVGLLPVPDHRCTGLRLGHATRAQRREVLPNMAASFRSDSGLPLSTLAR
jgi:hypothetical protein